MEMGLDIGKVQIEGLPRPRGLSYEFAQQLACLADCSGHGNAFGFYTRSDMVELAKEFAKGNALAEQMLKDWIAGLPWNEDGSLVLNFNW
jgi:hypothetical protein